MTVAELLERISAAELTEWIAYEEIAGVLGPERADMHTGIIAATIANANRHKGRKAKPEDFIPKWDRRAPQSWQEQLAAVKSINAAVGGAVSSRRHDGSTVVRSSGSPPKRSRTRRRRSDAIDRT